MKWRLKLLPILLLMKMGFSLTVLGDGGETIPIEPYLQKVQLPDQALMKAEFESQVKAVREEINPDSFWSFLYPVKSDFSPGTFEAHELEGNFLDLSFFVIGDDEKSLAWVQAHSEALKVSASLGFITNVDTPQRKREIETALGFSLIPATLEGSEAVFHTDKHYPFWVNHRKVTS